MLKKISSLKACVLEDGQLKAVDSVLEAAEWELRNPTAKFILHSTIEGGEKPIELSTVFIPMLLFPGEETPLCFETAITSGEFISLAKSPSVAKAIENHDAAIKAIRTANPDCKATKQFVRGQIVLELPPKERELADQIRKDLLVEILQSIPALQDRQDLTFTFYMVKYHVDSTHIGEVWLNYMDSCPLIVAFEVIKTKNGEHPAYTFFTGFDARLDEYNPEEAPILFKTRCPGLTEHEQGYSNIQDAWQGHTKFVNELSTYLPSKP